MMNLPLCFVADRKRLNERIDVYLDYRPILLVIIMLIELSRPNVYCQLMIQVSFNVA
jgi:hypothetical protein